MFSRLLEGTCTIGLVTWLSRGGCALGDLIEAEARDSVLVVSKISGLAFGSFQSSSLMSKSSSKSSYLTGLRKGVDLRGCDLVCRERALANVSESSSSTTIDGDLDFLTVSGLFTSC